MRIFQFFLMSMLVVMNAVSAETKIEKINLVTENYPPFNMQNGTEVTGVSTEIVRMLLDHERMKYSIEVYPWARAMIMAQDNPQTCVFSLSRTPERESLYKWIGPLVSNEWALFALESAHKNPKSLEEIKNETFGSYVGDAIVKYFEERKIKVDVTRADDLNIDKLFDKHIDYWATGKLIGQYILNEKKIKGIVPVLTFNKTEMYLGCNKNLPDSLVIKLQTALTKMKAKSEIRHIYNKYGYRP